MRKIFKFTCLTLLIFYSFTNTSSAQKREIVPLNKHFFILNSSKNKAQAYNQITTKESKDKSTSKIYTLSNRLVKTIEDSYNMSEKFNQRLIYRYDTLGQLTSFTLFNLDDRIYLTRYYRNDTILAEVLKADYDKVKITLPDNESIELGFNPYISGPPPLAVWNEYLAKNLDYPVSARRAGNSGTVVIAIKINEMGKLVEFELANPEHTARDLGREALRVVEKYDGFWRPAINTDGEVVEDWSYLPIRFVLSGDDIPFAGNLDLAW